MAAAAASRGVSPGGALLRSSRMFSLPPAIPPPSDDLSNFFSASATTAYPTHQVLTTTNAMRRRGDWGLKRALPLKKTTKSTHAMVRVIEMDSMEGITDYWAASDHGITLRKFQELNLPVTIPRPGRLNRPDINLPAKSSFEEDTDFTAVNPVDRAALRDKRWKFTGPWLAGMAHGEFVRWLEKTVRPKRPEFREFLKQKLVEDAHKIAAQEAQDKGEPEPVMADAASVSEEQVINYIRKLRDNKGALYDMVGQFLDLAPVQPPTTNPSLGIPTPLATPSAYAERGPPVTHPSAGLSYLRTSSFMENHPFYGPQKSHKPVETRVVRPRRQNMFLDAKFGVAGFITDRPDGDTLSNRRDKGSAYFSKIDPELKGGAKGWMQAVSASVNPRGCVEIVLDDADHEAYLVAQELLGAPETDTFRPPVPERKDNWNRERSSAAQIRSAYSRPQMSSSSRYGLGNEKFAPYLPKRDFGQ
ncbi:hypothetical protein OQA88_11155 [Cercophora sp. LCS_1]